MTQTSSLPLSGVRVLDLSRLLAGNMLTVQLADFGADVIKVESAQGDTLRDWKNQGKSIWWKVYARNKKSICLDLKSAVGKEDLLSLVQTCKHIGVEPFAYLRDVINRVSTHPMSRILELTPREWKRLRQSAPQAAA